MILGLDASALVKRYVSEPGSDQVGLAVLPEGLPALLESWKHPG